MSPDTTEIRRVYVVIRRNRRVSRETAVLQACTRKCLAVSRRAFLIHGDVSGAGAASRDPRRCRQTPARLAGNRDVAGLDREAFPADGVVSHYPGRCRLIRRGVPGATPVCGEAGVFSRQDAAVQGCPRTFPGIQRGFSVSAAISRDVERELTATKGRGSAGYIRRDVLHKRSRARRSEAWCPRTLERLLLEGRAQPGSSSSKARRVLGGSRPSSK